MAMGFFYLLVVRKILRLINFFVRTVPSKPVLTWGHLTLHISPGYVVVDVGDGLVLEGHEGREVFVIGKSGCFSACFHCFEVENFQMPFLLTYLV